MQGASERYNKKRKGRDREKRKTRRNTERGEDRGREKRERERERERFGDCVLFPGTNFLPSTLRKRHGVLKHLITVSSAPLKQVYSTPFIATTLFIS